EDNQALATSINQATAKNITVIAAAGNGYSNISISAPACIRNATAIAASTKSDTIAGYSNRNNLVKITAPGSSITSLNYIGGTRTASGTSAAVPHVSGAVALLQSYKRKEGSILTPSEIISILNSTALFISDSLTGLSFARPDLKNALFLADSSPPFISLAVPLLITSSINLTPIIQDPSIPIIKTFSLFSQTHEFNGIIPISNWMPGIHNAAMILTANDSKGFISLAIYNLTLDYPPELNISAIEIKEDENATVALSVMDMDNDTIIFGCVPDSPSFECTAFNSTISIMPKKDINGSFTFSLSANDGFVETVQTMSINITPVTDIYTDLDGTDFSVINISLQFNLTLSNEYGIINFTNPINFSNYALIGQDINLTKTISISHNLISVNSSELPELNASAILTLNNLTFNNPRIMKDNEVCLNCSILQYDNAHTLIFNIASFSSYYAEDYCGNGFIEDGEDCNTCPSDAGACPSSGGGSSGGGGGGSSGGGGGSSGNAISSASTAHNTASKTPAANPSQNQNKGQSTANEKIMQEKANTEANQEQETASQITGQAVKEPPSKNSAIKWLGSVFVIAFLLSLAIIVIRKANRKINNRRQQ
ncbi:S8 family serine peptidase, partial [archaeon]|nr:S8 family serine peptidase [archaeon]